MSQTTNCPLCGLPMSYADHGDKPVWVCDGPNDLTDAYGCNHAIPADDGEVDTDGIRELS